MIHGHHFYFADQPGLQAEYESFGFQRKGAASEAIVVRGMQRHPGFEQRGGISYMSGRRCAYLSDKPFRELGPRENWGLEVQDVLSLAWDAESRNIYYGKGEAFTPELLKFWIWHTFFPIVLDLERDYKIMHVGGVEIAGGAVLFSAASFGGKSTMTDYFIRKGHALYSDDAIAVKKVGDHYYAYPSFPYHRPYRKVESLGVPVQNFARTPAPIRVIFELRRSAPDAQIEIQPTRGVEKFNILHQSHFVRFRFLKHARFAFAMEMAKHVPVYTVTVPWDLERLQAVYDTILQFLSRL